MKDLTDVATMKPHNPATPHGSTTTAAIDLLARTKTSLGEVSLTVDEAAEMSRAMVVGNDREIGRLFREAALRHAREMVAGSNILDSDYETAMSLLRTYA